MKVLMVDVDGVLVHGRPSDGLSLFTYLERDHGLPLDTFQNEFFNPYWVGIVTGREPIEPRLSEVLKRIAPHLETETLLKYWFENDSLLDQRLLDRLGALRQDDVRLYLATNQEHRRAAYLMNEMGLGRHFDGIFYSADLGHRKPTHDFYRLATDSAGVSPSEIAFLDDMLENVEAAREFGWNAVQWMADMELETALTSLTTPHPSRQPIRL
ncbi:HAD family hydrolase [Neorhizobium lilium]|uniref:HAD family hydrolase n=1 Tax=Neorhizobium lilium TaxID=2503024 RepID=A0A3S3RS76_9HYPH|nr:HAD-IA family hydrolase [Neorhizobium lilium]RWX76686.1 HAD family hydrolase [Neorhizobium lilium]